MKKILINLPVFLSAFLLFVACNAQEKNLLDADTFQSQIKEKNVQLLDVRTATEYSTGHIAGALQADWLQKDQFADRVQHLDKKAPVYVYCAAGPRSTAAAAWLREEGFSDVRELKGGFNGWKMAQKPIEAQVKTTQLTMEQFHQMINGQETVLVDFGAPWCPPCKKMEPVVNQVEKENSKTKVIRIDGGIHTNLMAALQVDALPTFIVFKKGNETWRKQGIVALSELNTQLH
jgi:rhodanese-related sulfurtransferase